MIARRREIRRAYVEGFAGIDGVRILSHGSVRGDSDDNCWLTSIILHPSMRTVSSAALIKALNAADIEARYLWKPMHLQPLYSQSRAFTNGTSERLFAGGVALPSGSALSDMDIKKVLDVTRNALGYGHDIDAEQAAFRSDHCRACPGLSLPVQLAIAVAVAMKIGRPILFRQARPGLHGKPFVMVKFRTMLPIDPSRGWTDDASRMTPFGRTLRSTSLDELPTLWNIIRGDMSVVGPRPLLMKYLERYTPEQARRHEVRPGLTGLAQISGRNAISWEQKLALDVQYVHNRSLIIDFKMIVATIAWSSVGRVSPRTMR